MRPRVLYVAIVVVAAVVGWFIAPSLASTLGLGTQGNGEQNNSTQGPPSSAVGFEASPTAEVTTPAPSPSPVVPPSATPTPTPTPTLSPAQVADQLAGIVAGTVPAAGNGELAVVPGEEAAPNPDAEGILSVRVEVEAGLPIDAAIFSTFVMTTLNDDRGWDDDGTVSFARTDGDADLRVVLASPGTVDEMCAPLRTVSEYSCGRNGHAALNALRWVSGADAFLEGGGDLTTYRQYLVTHEVGHLLGHPHEGCPEPGAPAPVMLQQSMSLRGCAPNAWVNP